LFTFGIDRPPIGLHFYNPLFFYNNKLFENIELIKNQNYVYLIQLRACDRLDENFELYNNLPEKVLFDVKKGNCVVLFEYLFEGFRTIQGIHVKTIIKNFIDKFNFPANKIYYIDSNNLNNNIDIPCTCLSFRFLFEHYESGLSDNEIKEIYDKYNKYEKREYKFSCLNRIHKPFRFYLLYLLKDICKNNDVIYSYQALDYNNNIVKIDELYQNELKWYIGDINSSEFIKLNNSMPWNIDNYISCVETKYEFYTNSYFHVVVETLIGNDSIFFSEKTFKPIKMMQPFILVSCPHSLNVLKEEGYETFPELFNEEYDLIEDNKERIEFISNEIKRVYHMSHDELTKKLYLIKDKLVHNAVLFRERNKNLGERLYKVLRENISW